MIKKAKRSGRERWYTVMEQYESDLKEEIERHLKKIKKKLLGEEFGDLRSCAMKLIDTSPLIALQEIFDCCLDCFDGENHDDITNFLFTITENALARRLFQLALTVSCRSLIGETLDSMVQKEVDKQVASRMNDFNEKEELQVQPHSEGLVLPLLLLCPLTKCNIGITSRAIIRLRQIIDLLATDKSRYFAQARDRSIIFNYFQFLIQCCICFLLF